MGGRGTRPHLSIDERAGRLFVIQTDAGQIAVRDFIATLRGARNLAPPAPVTANQLRDLHLQLRTAKKE